MFVSLSALQRDWQESKRIDYIKEKYDPPLKFDEARLEVALTPHLILKYKALQKERVWLSW